MDIVEATADELRSEVERLRSIVESVEALRDGWLAVDVPSAEVTSWNHYAGAVLAAALAESTEAVET
jgi:hypothetical protein